MSDQDQVRNQDICRTVLFLKVSLYIQLSIDEVAQIIFFQYQKPSFQFSISLDLLTIHSHQNTLQLNPYRLTIKSISLDILASNCDGGVSITNEIVLNRYEN